MSYNRSIVLSVAGFDPCGGAGVLADVKTMEQHHCIGMAVNTAITYQVEDEFYSVDWLPVDKICLQIKQLMNRYEINVVKIGIVSNLEMLSKIIEQIKTINKDSKIIWDPVISASTGFGLGNFSDENLLKSLLKEISLITPNLTEALNLCNAVDTNAAAKQLAAYCSVLLKGGHSETAKGTDILFCEGKSIEIQSVSSDAKFNKHGSGCILSSAIASELANGCSLEVAVKKAKNYIDRILSSNNKLLAYHVA